jgi:bifunctional DNA primase/polymerase-like protein
MSADRPTLLDSYARAYARERFALIFTQGLDKRFGKGWPDANPVTSEDFAAALVVGRCLSEKSPRNVGVSLAASNLIGIEVDTAEGLALVNSRNLPPTWTVRSGGGGPGRHFYFRPPADDVVLFSFRIEAQGVTAERTRGLVLPPSIHPDTGAENSLTRSCAPA